MKQIIITFLACLISVLCNAQTTYFNGSWSTGTSECGRLTAFEIKEDGVIVTIEIKALKALKRLRIFSSYNTYITSGNEKLLSLSGLVVGNEIKSCGLSENWGWDNVAIGEVRSYQLFFKGALPSGITTISIVDYGDYRGNHGFCFFDRKINNPRKNYLNYQSEYAIKQYLDQNNDGICGIYEPIDESGAKLACVIHEGEYYIIYLSSPSNYSGRTFWNIGDIKAKLRKTPSGMMKAEWYMSNKTLATVYILFDGVSMVVNDIKTGDYAYLKTYPTTYSNIGGTNTNQPTEWSGTGYAIAPGYIVTNNHVIGEAKTITIKGVKGDINIGYSAEVVATDKVNDIAIIKINDADFKGFGQIPYAVQQRMADVGEDVFVLGYPLTQALGNEIKLTNGIVSSRTGYQGDIATYQISAPIQPGNSGGPMFDSKGNVIGIVVAGVPGADNVGYAIKTSYLKILIESAGLSIKFPANNTISTLSLAEKVKKLKNFVYYIECSK